MYMDVLLAFNFVMDLLVLLTAGLLCGRSGICVGSGRRRWLRLFLAAGFGTAGSCLLAAAGLFFEAKWLSNGVGALFAGILLCVGMAWIAYRPRTARLLLRQVAAVYGCAFLIGGICDWLQEHMQTLPYFMLLLVSAAAAAVLLWRQIRIREKRAHFVTVRIYGGSGIISVRALVDTGNTLTLPGTQTPVSVITREVLLPVLDREPEWIPVPYHSVGCAHGVLQAICVPHAYVTAEDGSERHLQRMWLAVSPEPLSVQGRYQMILHPAHIPLTE